MTIIDNAEDLDLVMQMCNLIEYSSNYSETRGSLWFYVKDETTNVDVDIANTNNFKSFKFKAELLGNAANGILQNDTIAVLLKYLSNFWRSFEMPFINCKVGLKLKWTEYCVLSAAGADNGNAADYIIFTIKGTKIIKTS